MGGVPSIETPTIDGSCEERHAPAPDGPECVYCGLRWTLHPDAIRAPWEKDGRPVAFWVEGPPRWRWRYNHNGEPPLWMRSEGVGRKQRRPNPVTS